MSRRARRLRVAILPLSIALCCPDSSHAVVDLSSSGALVAHVRREGTISCSTYREGHYQFFRQLLATSTTETLVAAAEQHEEHEPLTAVCVLEIAHELFKRGHPDANEVLTKAFSVFDRARGSTEFRRAWSRAALALIEGSGAGTDFGTIAQIPRARGPREEPWSNATARKQLNRLDRQWFEEGRLTLGEAILWEQVAWRSVLVVRTVSEAVESPLSTPVPPTRRVRDVRTANLAAVRRVFSRAIEALSDARKYPQQRVEATLRLGATKALLGADDSRIGGGSHRDALGLLDEVIESSDDSAVLYLAHLFRGRYLQATGELRRAWEAYQDALGQVPGATARLGFVTTQMALTDSLPSADVPFQLAADPWKDYRYGSYNQFPLLLEQTRTAAAQGS